MKLKLLLPLILLCINAFSQLPAPKNIIIMLGDGMGYNQITAAHYYLGKDLSFENFPVRLTVATYPAKAGEYEANDPNSNYIASGYNPSLAWKDTSYLKKDFTESAAASTAMSTGYKTYNNSIGLSVNHDTLKNLTEWAKSTGRAAGVVTSVEFSHATPAGFVAHNITRNNYREIAKSMILDSRCDVIMGCGNPAFDNDGRPVKAWKETKYTGDSIFWTDLLSGKKEFMSGGKKKTFNDCDGDGKPDAWMIITKADDFRKLASGKTPKRVLGCAEVNSTLQTGRTAVKSEDKNSMPFITPFIKTVPSLSEMTAGAINVLDNNKKGFFLMVEGGAIDWADHSNLKGRLLEEMISFDEAVAKVIQWVETNSNWDETLLIVTGDHETGLLWGDKPFEPVKDHGKGNMPGMTFYSGNHTNSLIALFAKGNGSELLNNSADEYDPVRGQFLQNTETAQLIHLLWYVK